MARQPYEDDPLRSQWFGLCAAVGGGIVMAAIIVVAALVWLISIVCQPAHAQDCIASVYSTRENGSVTASGIRLDDSAMTAAHKTIRPFGSQARVTNKRNGKSVIVTITDDGPHVVGRCVDLTPAGARALGFNGLASVSVEPVR